MLLGSIKSFISGAGGIWLSTVIGFVLQLQSPEALEPLKVLNVFDNFTSNGEFWRVISDTGKK